MSYIHLTCVCIRGRLLKYCVKVGVKAIIKVESKLQILCNQPPVWFCLQLNAGFELFDHVHRHLATLHTQAVCVGGRGADGQYCSSHGSQHCAAAAGT